MDRYAEMIGLMAELYGAPDKLRGRKSRAGVITPERAAIYRQVNAALKAGTIRQTDCADCGAYSQHAHHEDYSKPLEVIWLCADCHARRHRAEQHAAFLANLSREK